MRTAFLAGGLMVTAAAAAIVARPGAKLSDGLPPLQLETMIPTQFGDWREAPLGHVQVVNPQQQELLDRLYGQVLTRAYLNSGGYRIMLSLVYGSDQRERGSLQAHKPELCYPAQGFRIESNEAGVVATRFGAIPVRRLFASTAARHEPLTYWFSVGGTPVAGRLQKRLADLRYGLTGRIPDGMLFRVSSIDRDPSRAYRQQDQFIDQLLQAIAPAERKRLSGLGDS